MKNVERLKEIMVERRAIVDQIHEAHDELDMLATSLEQLDTEVREVTSRMKEAFDVV